MGCNWSLYRQKSLTSCFNINIELDSISLWKSNWCGMILLKTDSFGIKQLILEYEKEWLISYWNHLAIKRNSDKKWNTTGHYLDSNNVELWNFINEYWNDAHWIQLYWMDEFNVITLNWIPLNSMLLNGIYSIRLSIQFILFTGNSFSLAYKREKESILFHLIAGNSS